MDEKERSRNQLLQDLFSKIDPAIFDPELVRIITDFLENEGTDFNKPLGQVIIVPKQRLNISRETLHAYTADLHSIQTAIIAEQIQSEIIDEYAEKNEKVQDNEKAEENTEAVEMAKGNLGQDESFENDENAEVESRQNAREGAEIPEGTAAGGRTENDDAIESNDGVEREDFFSIRYLNPTKPEEGVLYIVAELTLEEIIMVARFQWVARLEMPKEYYAELKG